MCRLREEREESDSHCVVRMSRNGHCTSRRMGYGASERNPVAARQGCRKYGSKHVAHVPSSSQAKKKKKKKNRPNNGDDNDDDDHDDDDDVDDVDDDDDDNDDDDSEQQQQQP
ncbi:hypothetical protein PoB_001791700 [Plakobranchus ocellatus]|uniref:Uncharacterized protein n=1 Tax=Plakobranchus ocellatus TaxID=259542 RepID=A0AAV3Z846_9GAST|nr:hypothetical protein PoB_001791700 [Plakobranchus ocellatus]